MSGAIPDEAARDDIDMVAPPIPFPHQAGSRGEVRDVFGFSTRPTLAKTLSFPLELSPKAGFQGTEHRGLKGIGFGQFEEGSAAAFRRLVAESCPSSLGKVTARQCRNCGHISFNLLHRRVTGHLQSTLSHPRSGIA